MSITSCTLLFLIHYYLLIVGLLLVADILTSLYSDTMYFFDEIYDEISLFDYDYEMLI